MKHYETTIILTPVLGDDEVKQTVSSYTKFLKEHGADIVQEDHWGLKQLAYPIARKTTGVYHWIQFQAPGDVVAKLEVQFGRDDKIMRYLTINLDKHAQNYNERKRQGLAGRRAKPETGTAEKKSKTEKETTA